MRGRCHVTALEPRIVRNDWSAVPRAPAAPPTTSVSVVMPAYAAQGNLELALAALAAQTYPSALLEVVVVDDGSTPPLRLPELRPERTRIVRTTGEGWGRAYACHVGALAAEGGLIHWLDSDMLAFPDEVAEQVRWHQSCSYVVTTGYKRFVEPHLLSPQDVYRRARDGELPALFDVWETHEWVEEIIERTGQLRDADHECFRVAVGATGALRRDLYLEVGGMDTSLRLGEDSELGYRLAQGGAVFVPVRDAVSWHLGRSTAVRTPEAIRRYNLPFVADRMPLPRYRRTAPGRSWSVALVEVVVVVGDGSYEHVLSCVESVLASTLHDLVVRLVADWRRVAEDHRPPLADPRLDLRLIREHFRGDPRVVFAPDVAASAFPSAYRLLLAPRTALRPSAVAALVSELDQQRLGRMELACGGRAVGELARTAAVGRALRVRDTHESVEKVVSAVWGSASADLVERDLALDQETADPASVKALRRAVADMDALREEFARQRDDTLRWRREALSRGYGRPLWRWLPGHIRRSVRRTAESSDGPDGQ